MMPLDPKFTLPGWLELGAWIPAGFNRDGWRALDAGASPYVVGKLHPTLSGIDLQRRPAQTIHQGMTDRHAYAFRIVDQRTSHDHALGSADWMDWHPSGDVAVARDGTIARITITRHTIASGTIGEESTTIADFTGEEFEKLVPPASALAWPSEPID